MSDPRKGPDGDEVDWADALDEWEQKAFGGSVRPEAPNAEPAPIAPSAAPEDGQAQPDSEVVVSIGTVPASVDDGVLSSVELEVDVASSRPPAPPPPPPPPQPPAPPPARTAPPRIPRAERSSPDVSARKDEAPKSLVSSALHALSELRLDEPLRVSRAPAMPAPEVAPDLAALLAEQSAWLEAEALAAPEPTRATIFLSLSEIEATVGHTDRARSFASRARDLVPGSPLAHMQARALDAQAGTTLESEAAALIAEGACTELSAVKQHAAFLGADVLWRSGDVEGSLVMATRLAETGDVRGVIARIAWGLADADVDGLTAFVARAPAETTAPLTTLLRLRGVAVGEASAPASPDGVTDTFEAARLALARGEPIAAAKAVAELRAVPELAKGALWLASALGATSPEGRPLALGWLGELAAEGDAAARTSLAVRAVEAGDRAALVSALALGGFAPADEVALSALLGLGTSQLLPKLGDELGALAAAVGAFDAKADGENHAGVARADRVVGTDRARAERRMARLLAANAPVAELEKALAPLREARQEIADALELELALRANAYSRVSALIQKWQVDEPQAHVTDAALAAGLIAERTADPARALAAFREARMLDRSSEVALRALASLQASADLPGELNELADELGATVQGALARLEAVLREDSVDDATRAELYERAHRAAPLLPFAAFLAERIAKRTGNGEEVLHWINERSGTPTDPMLAVGDLLREARILMGRDPEGSVLRIADAHRARPGDLALREWYERTTPTSADDHAKYWEAQAREMSGDSRALLHLEIAHAYERAGDTAGVLRVVDAAGASAPLLDLARERAEADGGEAARLVDRLLTEAKNTDDDVVRREAYERLAEIDGVGRGDTGSALLWHKAILEAGHHLPSLRYVEQALIGEGRDEELEPVVASIAEVLLSSTTLPTDGGERVAHADLAARLRARGPNGDWEATFELATLATKDSVPSLASLRLLQAHARAKRDDDLLIRVSEQLLERATRPVEMAALRLRVAEAAFRENDLAQALASLEQSTNEDPGDLVAFRLLAEVRHASGDAAGAAEAHESVARLSMVQAHQLSAWYDAAELWLEDGEHQEEAMHAFEQAAALDLGHEDVFSRLSQLYAARGAHSDLAALLERRIAIAITPDERVTLEVERARALLAGGDRAAARAALDAALHDRPDHTTALATFGELSALEQDWERAEEAWVRLARLLSTPDEQRAIYERLGDLYSTKTVHLERAELAFKEVLKRVPGDTRTIERLIDVYRRQRDVGKAVEAQQELLAQVKTPAEKRDRTIELALLHEDPGHDERRAEQVLEAARREYPTDVVVLRALAEFYARHKQTPAVQILLDRAAADTRRAFAAGRFAPALFEVMHAIFDLRGQAGPARIVGASLSAIEGRPSDARGAFGAALDAKIDDLLAPDVLSPGLRALLLRAGSVLDVASPMDLRAMGAVVAGPEARTVQELVASFASGLGLVPATVYVSKTIGRTCLPVASDPPSLIVGESLLAATNERAVAFLVMRAMKLIAARASALIRTTSTDLAALVPAWLSAIAPKFTPQGLNPTALATATRKIAQAKLPPLNDEVVSLALEVAAQLGTRGSTLGGHATAWANRSALLGVGDPNAALEAIAWSLGTKDGAPEGAAARAAWIGRTHEAKDLLIFSVGDNYAEARARLHL